MQVLPQSSLLSACVDHHRVDWPAGSGVLSAATAASVVYTLLQAYYVWEDANIAFEVDMVGCLSWVAFSLLDYACYCC